MKHCFAGEWQSVFRHVAKFWSLRPNRKLRGPGFGLRDVQES